MVPGPECRMRINDREPLRPTKILRNRDRRRSATPPAKTNDRLRCLRQSRTDFVGDRRGRRCHEARSGTNRWRHDYTHDSRPDSRFRSLYAHEGAGIAARNASFPSVTMTL